MIAIELADALGADLGVETLDDLWDEIERLAPAHAGITRALLHAPGRADGIIVGRQDTDPAVGAATAAEVARRDPTAVVPPPTVVDGASRSVGLRIQGYTVAPVVLRLTTEHPHAAGAEEESGAEESEIAPAAGEAASSSAEPVVARPAVITWDGSADGFAPPVLDAYSLRLVATRALYDDSVSVRQSPSLAGLSRPLAVRLHPGELERIGVTSGGRVRISSNRTTLTVDAVADAGVPRGSAAVVFNLPGSGAADLIDAAAAVTDVRVETP
jgi:anaerobic selenocysteine-containing dehydrogenase